MLRLLRRTNHERPQRDRRPLTLIVVSIGFALWVADVRTTDDPDRYVVIFERDVSGLSLGSPVRYLGVDVGQVDDMRLITHNGTRVAVTIDVLATTPIDRGTYASLAYQGITGVAFISLAADAGDYPPLATDGVFEHPVIPTRDVGLAALLAESGNITSQVGAALDRVNELLGDDNRASIGRTLANLESLSCWSACVKTRRNSYIGRGRIRLPWSPDVNMIV